MKLTVLVPCYNEESNIETFFNTCEPLLQSIEHEYIFIDDGSKDQTLIKLKMLFKKHDDVCIQIISFSRNFGKEAAMYAGFQSSNGEYIVIIDVDLQQNPKYICKMMDILENNINYDSVAAYQDKRKESRVIACFKSLFYKLINRISEIEFVNGASDFRMFRKYMIDAVLQLSESNRFSKGIFSWVGFNTCYIPYDVEERHAGKSTWSFWGLFKYAVNGFISFSGLPLKISTFFGIVFSFFSFIYLIVVLVQKIFFSIMIPGYATIICLILLIGGIQLFCLGIIGEYLSKTYLETKRRPIYIIKDYMERKQRNNDDKL